MSNPMLFPREVEMACLDVVKGRAHDQRLGQAPHFLAGHFSCQTSFYFLVRSAHLREKDNGGLIQPVFVSFVGNGLKDFQAVNGAHAVIFIGFDVQ